MKIQFVICLIFLFSISVEKSITITEISDSTCLADKSATKFNFKGKVDKNIDQDYIFYLNINGKKNKLYSARCTIPKKNDTNLKTDEPSTYISDTTVESTTGQSDTTVESTTGQSDTTVESTSGQ